MRNIQYSITKLILISALLATVLAPVQARDQIQIVGSSTVYPFSQLVAKHFSASGSYKAPVIKSTGTGGGFKLFCKGVGVNTVDITNASRAIEPSEIKTCKENGVSEIIQVQFGNDGIAFANSKKATKFNFTRNQLWTAMAEHGSKSTYWNEISDTLPNIKIAILIPPPSSGTRDAWNALVMTEGCPNSVKKLAKKACQQMREDGALIEAGEDDELIIRELQANPNLFGIFGFSYLENNSDKIQGSNIEGVKITLNNIQGYDYPISRPLFFYVKKAHLNLVPGISQYLDTFADKDAIGDRGYLADAGMVPLTRLQRAMLRSISANKIGIVSNY